MCLHTLRLLVYAPWSLGCEQADLVIYIHLKLWEGLLAAAPRPVGMACLTARPCLHCACWSWLHLRGAPAIWAFSCKIPAAMCCGLSLQHVRGHVRRSRRAASAPG